MSPNPVLVIDAGTSSIRCHLVDPTSEITRSISRPWIYTDESPHSSFPRTREPAKRLAEQSTPDVLSRNFDLEACWHSLCDAIIECVGDTESRPSAVAITSQRQSLVFTDTEGHPIYAGPNTDVRAVFQGAALEFTEKYGRLLYDTTGHRPAFMMAAGKLAWLRDTQPSAYSRLTHVLTLADWLAYRLTGQIACEPTLAAASGLIDIRTRAWTSEMFDELDLSCPETPLREATQPRGSMIANELRLLTGAPVVVAGADTQTGMIGSGGVEAGQVAIVAGWSAPVQMLVPEPVLSPDMKTWTGLFQIQGLWAMESSAGDIGNAWRWLAETFFTGARRPYARMDRLAASVPPGSEGVTGHFGPAAMDVSTVGMRLGGILFPTPMTMGGPTPGQISRAALESFAYTIRANLEQLERESGMAASRVALGGGLSRSSAFRQILPSVLGRPISTSREHNVTATGSAMIARTAIGEYDSIAEAAVTASHNTHTIEPNPTATVEYQDHYQRWQEVHESIGPLLR